MKIGFTGTRDDMTDVQKSKLLSILTRINNITPFTESHDGDCIGSDKTFHKMMMKCFPNAKRHSHPCNFENYRAHCERFDKDVIVHKPKPPLIRNQDIVDEGEDYLFATPKGDEILRSGTWATIRYAKKQSHTTGVVVHVIYPDGQHCEIDFGPTKCPECHSKNWEQAPPEVTEGKFPFLDCKDCGHRWWSD